VSGVSLLVEAIEALNRRKLSVDERSGETLTDMGRMLPVFVGTDVDPHEVSDLAMQFAYKVMAATVEQDVDAVGTIAGLWIDGILVGQIMAEKRARREACA
jgi:hypothetical protein